MSELDAYIGISLALNFYPLAVWCYHKKTMTSVETFRWALLELLKPVEFPLFPLLPLKMGLSLNDSGKGFHCSNKQTLYKQCDFTQAVSDVYYFIFIFNLSFFLEVLKLNTREKNEPKTMLFI